MFRPSSASQDNTNWRTGGPGQVGGLLCFQMTNVNFRQAAQKTEGRASRLHKRMVWWDAKKDGAGCRKGQPSGPPFSAAQLNVQPADRP